MSAVESAVPPARKRSIELTLSRASSSLDIYCCSGSHVHVNLYTTPRDKRAKRERLVFAIASFGPKAYQRQDFRLDLKYENTPPSLWLGSTSFELTAEEARRIEETFAPHGLEVERKEFTS